MNYKLILLFLGAFALGFILGKTKFKFSIMPECPAIKKGRQILTKLDYSDTDYLE